MGIAHNCGFECNPALLTGIRTTDSWSETVFDLATVPTSLGGSEGVVQCWQVAGMDERPSFRKSFGWGTRLVAVNLPVPRIALEPAGLRVEAPDPQLRTGESQLQPIV